MISDENTTGSPPPIAQFVIGLLLGLAVGALLF